MKKIMILGSGFTVGPDGSPLPNRAGRERLDRALRHNNEMGGRALILCSGGYAGAAENMDEPPLRLREAYAMADYLMRNGISSDMIELETESTSTVTNFTYSLREGLILPNDGPISVVTHPYHMRRAKLITGKLDLELEPVPTDEQDEKRREQVLFRLYQMALLGANGVDELERRERVLLSLVAKRR